VLAVLKPQYIWPWTFDDIRASFIVSLATLAGTGLAIVRGTVDLNRLKNTQTFCVLGIWAFLHLSNLLTVYGAYDLPANMIPPEFIIEIFNTIAIFYILAVLLIDSSQKLNVFAWIIILSAIYLIYWANMIYLTGDMWKHQIDGRLKGPGGYYSDNNVFAIFFVVAQPLIFYMGVYAKKSYLKYFLWLLIPFLWHAIFLTGSRGGLLSLFVVTFFMAWSLKSKGFSILLLIGLLVALVDQGGEILDRTESTIYKRQMISEDEKIDPRIESWTVGLKITFDNPLFGVGTGRFQQAALDYGSNTPNVAHNTLLQISANSGIFPGFLYLLLFYNVIRLYFKHRAGISWNQSPELPHVILEATVTSLLGFFVGAMFLDLLIFEPFYYLLALCFIAFSILDNKYHGSPHQAIKKREARS